MLKNNKSAIKNPCIHVCTLDEQKICIGCHRSVEEIRGWFTMTDDQKRDVLLRAESRRREKDAHNYDRYV